MVAGKLALLANLGVRQNLSAELWSVWYKLKPSCDKGCILFLLKLILLLLRI
jgi:hypothetical protein